MTASPASTPGDPQQLLDATRQVTRHVRQEQRGAWFPLLVFAGVTFGAIPFDRYGHRHPSHCTSLSGGQYVCSSYSPLALWYWPVALLLAYGAITWFYRRRASQLGVGTRVQPYLLVGIALVLLITTVGLWALEHPAFRTEVAGLHVQSPSPLTGLLYALLSPAGAIGLALLLLAWIERSWLLVAITTAYLVVVLGTLHMSRMTHASAWAFLPHLLLDGGVLLIGCAALALITRAGRGSSA